MLERKKRREEEERGEVECVEGLGDALDEQLERLIEDESLGGRSSGRVAKAQKLTLNSVALAATPSPGFASVGSSKTTP